MTFPIILDIKQENERISFELPKALQKKYNFKGGVFELINGLTKISLVPCYKEIPNPRIGGIVYQFEYPSQEYEGSFIVENQSGCYVFDLTSYDITDLEKNKIVKDLMTTIDTILGISFDSKEKLLNSLREKMSINITNLDSVAQNPQSLFQTPSTSTSPLIPQDATFKLK